MIQRFTWRLQQYNTSLNTSWKDDKQNLIQGSWNSYTLLKGKHFSYESLFPFLLPSSGLPISLGLPTGRTTGNPSNKRGTESAGLASEAECRRTSLEQTATVRSSQPALIHSLDCLSVDRAHALQGAETKKKEESVKASWAGALARILVWDQGDSSCSFQVLGEIQLQLPIPAKQDPETHLPWEKVLWALSRHPQVIPQDGQDLILGIGLSRIIIPTNLLGHKSLGSLYQG